MLEISMLLADNNRSKAYLQGLIANNIYPKYVIFMKDDRQLLPEQSESISIIYKDYNQRIMRKIKGVDFEFDERETIEGSLIKNNIEYIKLNTLNVNDDTILNAIKKCPTKHIIFSAPGGSILGKKALLTGKLFIHVHPGDLPKYKGSTTFYYSMLIEKNICCSVIVLNEKIDSGKILYKKHFDMPKEFLDYDKVYDPIIRGKTLLDFLKKDNFKEGILGRAKRKESENEFYIIHPVLKHIAIMKTRGNIVEDNSVSSR